MKSFYIVAIIWTGAFSGFFAICLFLGLPLIINLPCLVIELVFFVYFTLQLIHLLRR